MLGEDCELQKLIGALMERLQLKEDTAVRLLKGLKAASPGCYRHPLSLSFQVPLEEDHRDANDGNARLHAELLIQSGVKPLRGLQNPPGHLVHGFCGLVSPQAHVLP